MTPAWNAPVGMHLDIDDSGWANAIPVDGPAGKLAAPDDSTGERERRESSLSI